MAINVSYPGVYIQELPSGVRTIIGVPTSVTAFVGRTRRGPVGSPTQVASIEDFTRRFGGLWAEAPLGYSVSHYYLNGGVDALIVRIHTPSAAGEDDIATAELPDTGGAGLTLSAADPGEWGNALRATVEVPTDGAARFHLLIEELESVGSTTVVASERFINLTSTAGHTRFVTDVLRAGSRLARVLTTPAGDPKATTDPIPFTGGNDGLPITKVEVPAALAALDQADVFNLLCIPPLQPELDPDLTTWDAAARYCTDRRAMLLVDPPASWSTPEAAKTGLTGLTTSTPNAAVYFPRIHAADPLKENRLGTFAPSGAVAGVIARMDGTRGVWKSPAGLDATLFGVPELDIKLTNSQNGDLNKLGVNCLRSFPNAGRVVWGARTRRGADDLADQWKYLAVRRTALYIEESLYRGTQWVVFEPNDEPLWSQIRLNVGAFMNGMFRQGAFQGTTPAQAYFVKCDRAVNPQEDIDRGIVNIMVGFAPLKPAEFVIISIQQLRPVE